MNALRRAYVLPVYQGSLIPHPPFEWWRAPEKSYRKVRRLSPTDTIVIHATAGASSGGAMSVANAGRASWHALIPDEDEAAHGKHIWRCVPDESAAWHVLHTVKHPADGQQAINDRSLGIEIVNAQNDSDKFSVWQVDITADLVAHWCSKHPIQYIYTHAFLDPSRKLDPGQHFPWDRFIERVQKHLSGTQLKVVIYPDDVVCDCNPEIVEGVTRCDLRPLAEALGASVVSHVPDQNKVYVIKATAHQEE